MLVYLDTAHFDYLERPENRASADRLFETWEKAECELALSFLHFREFYLLRSNESIKRRLAVLEQFPKIRFSPEESLPPIEYEIREQLQARVEGREPDFAKIRHTVFPPKSEGDFEVVRLAMEDGLSHTLRQMEESSTAFLNASRPQRELWNKAIEIARRKPLSYEIDPALLPSREELEKAVQGGAEDRVLALLEEIYRRVPSNRPARSYIDDVKRLAESLPYLKTLSQIPKAASFLEEDIGFTGKFFEMAVSMAEATPDLVGQRVVTMWRLVTELDPYDCPGYSLAMAVERARYRSEKHSEPGSIVDMQHVMLMPYVDLAFVDKRTFEYLRAETQRQKRPLPKARISHICKQQSLDSLRVEIESRAAKARKERRAG